MQSNQMKKVRNVTFTKSIVLAEDNVSFELDQLLQGLNNLKGQIATRKYIYVY